MSVALMRQSVTLGSPLVATPMAEVDAEGLHDLGLDEEIAHAGDALGGADAGSAELVHLEGRMRVRRTPPPGAEAGSATAAARTAMAHARGPSFQGALPRERGARSRVATGRTRLARLPRAHRERPSFEDRELRRHRSRGLGWRPKRRDARVWMRRRADPYARRACDPSTRRGARRSTARSYCASRPAKKRFDRRGARDHTRDLLHAASPRSRRSSRDFRG